MFTKFITRWRAAYEDWKLCPWCKGTRIFHPQLPLACPRCNGTGKRRTR